MPAVSLPKTNFPSYELRSHYLEIIRDLPTNYLKAGDGGKKVATEAYRQNHSLLNTTIIPRWPTLVSVSRLLCRKIVRFCELGGPEVLKIEDMPSRQPSHNEVALSVHAIGLNRAESMFMHGYYLEPAHLPARLGFEASGIVTAIGPNVEDSWLNKPVSTIPAFSMNQYDVLGNEVIVPVHALAEYPGRLTPIEATSIWMQDLPAYGALIELGRVKKC